MLLIHDTPSALLCCGERNECIKMDESSSGCHPSKIPLWEFNYPSNFKNVQHRNVCEQCKPDLITKQQQ